MRIGLVIYGTIDTISGGYLYDRMLADYLRRRGDRVEVVSLSFRSYASNILAHNLSSKLLRKLAQAPFDALLQDELNHASLFWLNRRLRGKVNYPIVALVHHLLCKEVHPAWQKGFYRWVERSYLATADAFIFNSDTTRRQVETLVGGGRPAVLAYPGGDRLLPRMTEKQVAARARRPGPLEVIFVGNLIPRKGLHTLLAALALLPHESWRLNIVGSPKVDPAYARAVQKQIEKMGPTARVKLRGSVPDGELSGLLSRSHLLSVPSSYEGLGIVYLEAMGFGLPAISSTSGGAHEVITHAQNGFLISREDVETLALYIHRLSLDRELLKEMSLAALGNYSERPTWTQSARCIRDFLEEIAG